MLELRRFLPTFARNLDSSNCSQDNSDRDCLKLVNDAIDSFWVGKVAHKPTSNSLDVAKDWHILEVKVLLSVRLENVVDLLIFFPKLIVLAGFAFCQFPVMLLKFAKLLT